MCAISKKLVLKSLGGYTLTYAGEVITLGRGGFTKAVQLLILLLLHEKEGIPKEELIRNLYSWEEDVDTNNSINSLIWRLKTQLVNAGMPKEDYISIKNGICKWVSSIPLEIDAVLLEHYYDQASAAEGMEQRELLEKVIELYNSEFLPQLSNELWVTVENVRLKKLFVQGVQRLASLYEEEEKYQKIFDIYEKTAGIYPFDGWQEKMIEVLQKMERYDEAFRIYQDTVRLYSNELGAPPSPKMRELFQQMNGRHLNDANDFTMIQDDLREKERKNGAYYCTYPSFVDAYRLICRIIERSGQSVYLMVCTLHREDELGDNATEDENYLGVAIEKALRRGDMYTRYNGSQYLVLLPAAQRENCDMIFQRIVKWFQTLNESSKCWLEYDVTEVSELPEIASGKIRFKKKNKAW